MPGCDYDSVGVEAGVAFSRGPRVKTLGVQSVRWTLVAFWVWKILVRNSILVTYVGQSTQEVRSAYPFVLRSHS